MQLPPAAAVSWSSHARSWGKDESDEWGLGATLAPLAARTQQSVHKPLPPWCAGALMMQTGDLGKSWRTWSKDRSHAGSLGNEAAGATLRRIGSAGMPQTKSLAPKMRPSASDSALHSTVKSRHTMRHTMKTTMRPTLSGPLPKISSASLKKAPSFEDIFSAAQTRAAKKRADQRAVDIAEGKVVMWSTDFRRVNAKKNRTESKASYITVASKDTDASEEESESEDEDSEDEDELMQMNLLVGNAVSALGGSQDDDPLAGLKKKRGSRRSTFGRRGSTDGPRGRVSATVVSPKKSEVDDDIDKLKKQEAALAAQREKDSEEVAALLKPPDIGGILARLNRKKDDFSTKEMRQIEQMFVTHRAFGSSDVHVDSIYEILAGLGYLTVEAPIIEKFLAEITSFATLDFDELTEFVSKYSKFEKTHIREVFQEFDEDGSGELDTEEVKAVLEGLGCSPFKGTLTRLINAVDADGSGTLDFNEFVALIAVYKQTDGFSHKEVRDIWRVFSRLAQDDTRFNVRTLPHKELANALIVMFGAQCEDLIRTLVNEHAESPTSRQQADQGQGPSPGQGPCPSNVRFRQFVAWVRRMKEAEIKEYTRQFIEFDESGDGQLDKDEIRQLLRSMGYTPLRSTIKDLIDAVDEDGGGTIDIEEFLDVMEYFKKWLGFTAKQAAELQKAFNKYKNDEGEVTSLQVLDLLRSLGEQVKMSKVHVLVAKVDVDGTNSLDFKEFLRLMSIQREMELTRRGKGFRKVVDFIHRRIYKRSSAIEGKPILPVDNTDLKLQSQYMRDALEFLGFSRLSETKLQGLMHGLDEVDFDEFVEITDYLQRDKMKKSKMQAYFTSSEMRHYRHEFESYDEDGSGEIDRDELVDVVKGLGLELATKEDQRKLINFINQARKNAEDSGLPPEEVGQHGTVTCQFYVFLHLARLIQRQKDEQKLEEENAVGRALSFSNKAVSQLRALFSYWATRAQDSEEEEEELDSEADESVNLSFHNFCRFLRSVCTIEKKQDIDLAELNLRKLAADPYMEIEAEVEQPISIGGNRQAPVPVKSPPNYKREMERLPQVAEVDFSLFLRIMRWATINNFGNVQSKLNLD
eukprot:TRINITY_DN37206_c0_g1_i1.p1 TRINITY_DN37206_c0_g1~~TRINITY_DN37206_c0_g1_i1.p1  ORF type:complete len:1109 (+),score=258.33 TRINITY_DN37206_c0_g1_i1:58-3327(+)